MGYTNGNLKFVVAMDIYGEPLLSMAKICILNAIEVYVFGPY